VRSLSDPPDGHVVAVGDKVVDGQRQVGDRSPQPGDELALGVPAHDLAGGQRVVQHEAVRQEVVGDAEFALRPGLLDPAPDDLDVPFPHDGSPSGSACGSLCRSHR